VLVKLGRFPEAYESFDRATEGDPVDLAMVWADKGMAYSVERKFDEAIASFDKALQIDPDHLPSLMGKGSALCQQGFFKEAIQCFDRILEIDPLHARARKYQRITLDKFDRVGGKSQRRFKDFS
jgi:tetratricopeptide (TPR) repeat protein